MEAEDPLVEEDTLVEDPQWRRRTPDGGGPLDPLEGKDHQDVKELLGP